MTINLVLGRTTQQIPLSFLNEKILKVYDDGLLTGMILSGLKRALELINYDILSRKLSIIGFLIILLNCFNLIYLIISLR